MFFQMFCWKSCNNLKMRTLDYEMFAGKFTTAISWKRCVFDRTHQLCLLLCHHCSLNDNFHCLASSWNQMFIEIRSMTSIVLDMTMSTKIHKFLKNWIPHNGQKLINKVIETANHNLLIELVRRKKWIFNFLKMYSTYF